jgi:uncharacterized protein YkwD
MYSYIKPVVIVIVSIGLVTSGYVVGKLTTSVAVTPIVYQSHQPTYDQYSELNVDNVMVLINDARLEKGLKQLADATILQESSKIVANQMAISGCSHDAIRALRKKGKPYIYISEAVSCNTKGARKAVEGLLASPSHADEILNSKYDSIGIAISNGNVVIHIAKWKDIQ